MSQGFHLGLVSVILASWGMMQVYICLLLQFKAMFIWASNRLFFTPLFTGCKEVYEQPFDSNLVGNLLLTRSQSLGLRNEVVLNKFLTKGLLHTYIYTYI